VDRVEGRSWFQSEGPLIAKARVCSLGCVFSGGATPGHTRANALAEIPPPWLPPWQSKAVIIKIYIKIIFTALADATIELSMPCHEQLTGADTVCFMFVSSLT